MTPQYMFLAMVLIAFTTFMVVLGGVSTWIMLGNYKAARVAAKSRPAQAPPETFARAA
jgi:hypothetical protein